MTRGTGTGDSPVMIHIRDALSATGMWSFRQQRLTSAMTVNEWRDDDTVTPDAFTLYRDGVTILSLIHI